MTDDRNDAAAPPPFQPAPPPAPAPAPGAARPKPWGWIVAGLLALVLIVLVTLYFMGVFDREQRREEIPWNGSAPAPSTATGDQSVPQPPPAVPAPAPAALTVTGTWGPRCPGSRAESITFLSNGRFISESDEASYTIVGDVVTMYGTARTVSLRWEMLGPDSARVALAGGSGRPDIIYRCP